ncbi:glutamyl-tRNA reductase [Horticoccus luteus]|uniref:Glutamyl-tRNA reductase n=1 Tax=Horticoccus luteus TaxID=2862869 RepID=A0A8F9TY26_9BACT|nr:glutamyl-tRNA reductase [Horticoccus luteus]QYM79969.1 glutamyl-tRNA reductase [Horticoccus luteus]
MSKGLFVLGATHHTTPIAVRERLSLPPEAAAELQAELAASGALRELTVLNTCNRVEFYGVATSADAVARVEAAFCSRQHFAPAEFQQFRLHLAGPDAVRHLFEVAAGLDSQMLGEAEILGQVKQAYAAAQAAGHTGAVLNRLFQKAFQAAKHIRATTAIGEGHVSVANVAVDLALTIYGDLASTRILLLGAGEIGEKTARAFQSRGSTSLTVSSRRLERAMELATALGASALPFEQHESRLAEFDIVVCCTSAPAAVIPVPLAAAAIKKRSARPLFFIDLALPRDVDADVARLDNVFVYNLDDLAQIAAQNRAAREAELAKCRLLVGEKATAVWNHISPALGGLAGSPARLAEQSQSA